VAKVTKDRQILIENPHGIDSTDGRGDGQAHGVGKRFGGGECALRDTLARTAHALHSHGCDASLIDDGQDIVFKTAEARVQGIKRHLDNIESIAPGEHLQVDRRVLVSVKSHEADLSLLLCLGEGFENTVVRVDQLGVIVEDDLVNLPDIEMIGLQPVERCLQHAHRSFWTRVRGEGAHHDDIVSFAFEGDAELLFAEAFVKLPGTVQDLQTTNEALLAEGRERKQTEEALRRSEAYLAESQRLAHRGGWASKGGVITHWSEESFRIRGFDPQEGPPISDIVLQRIHLEDRDRLVECSRKGISERRDYVIEGRIVLPDGTVKHIHSSPHPALSPSGELLEVVGTHVDITERKRAEEERQRFRQLEADLAHLNRVSSMGELTASLEHEVNQPIAAAVTDANTCLRWLARDQPDLDEARAASSRSINDVTRAAEIIKRVRLLFYKDASQHQWVDLNEVIRAMMHLLHGEAAEFAISVRTELAADLPQVMGDRVQLQQVLMNLMMNSVDAMKEVDGTRELTLRSQRGKDGQVLVLVSDTGVGLPLQKTEQIFDAFFTTKPHGTGMGLRISCSIVESYGGRLWATANSPRGANFYLALSANA
jgi:PAS domain S-box-containing protein